MSERTDEFVYEGASGQTRRETVQVLQEGQLVSVALVVAVNAATDPELAKEAREGGLHRLADGSDLAQTFVYHDPAARLFWVVVPPSIRHRVHRERAAVLARLADDGAPVPDYVAAVSSVVGADGLRAALDAPERVRNEEAGLSERETQLDAREARLVSRAESMTTAEDEIRLERERLDALQRELLMRENELEARFATLREREDALTELAEEGTGVDHDLASAVLLDDEGENSLEDSVEVLDADAADVQTLDGTYDPLEGAELVDSLEMESLDAADLEEVEPDEVLDLDGEELLDEETAQELDPEELEAVVADDTTIHRSEAPPAIDAPLPTAATPPEHFLNDLSLEMATAATPSEIWLFARLSEGHEAAFRSDDVELLTQYLVVDGYPVVLLALVEWSSERPYVRRAALDPLASDDLALLERLRDNLAVTVAIFGPEGRFERTVEVSAPERRTNLSMALERAQRAESDLDAPTALERALAAPPPVKLRGHPFELAGPAKTARDAFQAVANLAKWSAPAKLDMALLALSIPRDIVDDSFRRILADAVRHGVCLPQALVSRAVSLGVASEPGELITQLIDAFRGTSALPEQGGLKGEVVAHNWEQLLEMASEYDVSMDSEVHDFAWKAIAQGRGAAAPKEVDVASLPDKTIDALLELLEHPRVRKDAALELLRRGDPELVGKILRAARKMPRDEVLEVVPRVIPYGESAADGLIDGLEARKTFVRQASALALGELKLRRSIAPLVQLLQGEPTDVWWEVGRVVGSFGESALRSLKRAMKDPKSAEDRLAYTLVHLARTSAEKVDQLHADANSNIKRIAISMVTQRELVDQHSRAVDPSEPEPEEGIFAFSRRFYEVLRHPVS
ncbi:MAG: hypothetical protein AAGE52_08030 [Myxococcota bacterium]